MCLSMRMKDYRACRYPNGPIGYGTYSRTRDIGFTSSRVTVLQLAQEWTRRRRGYRMTILRAWWVIVASLTSLPRRNTLSTLPPPSMPFLFWSIKRGALSLSLLPRYVVTHLRCDAIWTR